MISVFVMQGLVWERGGASEGIQQRVKGLKSLLHGDHALLEGKQGVANLLQKCYRFLIGEYTFNRIIVLLPKVPMRNRNLT